MSGLINLKDLCKYMITGNGSYTFQRTCGGQQKSEKVRKHLFRTFIPQQTGRSVMGDRKLIMGGASLLITHNYFKWVCLEINKWEHSWLFSSGRESPNFTLKTRPSSSESSGKMWVPIGWLILMLIPVITACSTATLALMLIACQTVSDPRTHFLCVHLRAQRRLSSFGHQIDRTVNVCGDVVWNITCSGKHTHTHKHLFDKETELSEGTTFILYSHPFIYWLLQDVRI